MDCRSRTELLYFSGVTVLLPVVLRAIFDPASVKNLFCENRRGEKRISNRAVDKKCFPSLFIKG
jgi:hypothetical protein